METAVGTPLHPDNECRGKSHAMVLSNPRFKQCCGRNRERFCYTWCGYNGWPEKARELKASGLLPGNGVATIKADQHSEVLHPSK
jgi:hypothetical protein